jgi:hypothetical protein
VLDGPDLFVDLARRAAVDGTYHVREGEGPPLYVHLDHGRHVDVLEQDAPTEPVA